MCNQGIRICITNRKLVKDGFFAQLEYVITKYQVDRIILREILISLNYLEILNLKVEIILT